MIVVEGVSKFYGRSPAVRDLSFRIAEGECVGFLGLNGAGKSTTLRLLSCLLLPTSGSIRVGGFDAERQPHEIRKLIGYLPDSPPLYPEMRVDEYLRFAGRLRRMTGAELEKRLPRVLEQTGLTRVADAAIETLSHGYKQRVGIAQAVIHAPKLLILDEPVQGLDPVQIVEMRQLIRSLRGAHTILLSSHLLSEIERTCDRILILKEGRLVASGTEEEVVEQMSARPASSRDAARLHWAIAEVRGTEEQVRAALAAADLTIVELRSTAGGICRVKIESGSDSRERVAARIVGAGLGLLTLTRSQSALEDVFVALTAPGGEAPAARAAEVDA
ncbi:MAG: ABC transporter ATP-binding protein [Sandaracinaceae bacterium]|nr:ABC transporter ATP-binding protein [Sandaracinaceae bacterium]